MTAFAGNREADPHQPNRCSSSSSVKLKLGEGALLALSDRCYVSIRFSAASRRATVSSSEQVSSAMLNLDTLEAIKRLENADVRFMAAIGACMSTASMVENALYQCYLAASKQAPQEATEAFYKVVNFDHKRNVTNLAVSGVTEGKNALRWGELNSEAQTLLGRQGARNLAGHNAPFRYPGSYLVYWEPGTRHPFTGELLKPKQEWLEDPDLERKLDTTDAPYFVFQHEEAELLQNRSLVEAGKRPPQRKTQSELLADVERLIVLRDNLYSFANKVLRKSPRRPRRSTASRP